MSSWKKNSLLVMIVLAQTLWPLDATGEKMIYSLDTKRQKITYGKEQVLSERQRHYRIRFEEGENFLFIVPEAYIHQKRGIPFFDQGARLYTYQEDEDEPVIPFTISNRLLMFREGLLSAESYFIDVSRDAGLAFTFWEPGRPIRVLFGNPGPGNFGMASFRAQLIVVDPDLGHISVPDQLVLTAVHEYFHMLTGAVAYRGNQKEFIAKQNRDPFRLFLHEMTAQWATDEPISFWRINKRIIHETDELNEYLFHRASRFLKKNKTTFFAQNEYDAALLIKFFAEQVAGKKDESSAAAVLHLIRVMYDMGGINEKTFFKAITEKLPGANFNSRRSPERWQLKWHKFFRAFCASNVVQKAVCMTNADTPVGYHDDAFARMKAWYANTVEPVMTHETSVHSERIYYEPARTDEERLNRLESIALPDDEIAPLAYHLHRIQPCGPPNQTAVPRPVFLFARGAPGTDVFALRQTYREGSHTQRKGTRFEWRDRFALSDEYHSEAARVYDVISNVAAGDQKHALWVGLVNADTELAERSVAWGYQFSPRLIPWGLSEAFPDVLSRSGSIQISGGSALARAASREFFNGDSFEIRFRTTGPLHRRGANPGDLKTEDLSADIRIVDESGNEIGFDQMDGTIFTTSRFPPYEYAISGKIWEHNPFTGKCRFHISITSPLNLGGDDRQTDESFTFNLRPIHPNLNRLILSSHGPQDPVIYDSARGIRKLPAMPEDQYELSVAATFSLPMIPDSIRMTAGPSEPYTDFTVQDIQCPRDNRECRGTLVVPVSQIPKGGMLLRFAVSGKSDKGELDGDLLTAGSQPDTRHFLLMGIPDYYELWLSSRSHQRVAANQYTSLAELGPIQFHMQLIPLLYDPQNGTIPSAPGPVIDKLSGTENLVSVYTKYVGMLHDLIARYRLRIKNIQTGAQMQAENPAKSSADDIADLEQRLWVIRAALKQMQPEKRAYARKLAHDLEQQIERLRSGKASDPAKRKQLALKEKQTQLLFLTEKLQPLMESALRVINGLHYYTYWSHLRQPVQASFDGVLLSGKQSTAGKNAIQGKGFFTVAENIQAPGWQTRDVERLGMSFPKGSGPALSVWEFSQEDYRNVQKLAAMSGNYPAFFNAARQAQTAEYPPASGSDLSDSREEMEIRSLLNLLVQCNEGLLIDLSQMLWEFFPKQQHPATARSLSGQSPVLPEIITTRLIRMENVEALPNQWPIHMKGKRHFSSGLSEAVDQKANVGWAGVSAPPDMISRSAMSNPSYSVLRRDYEKKFHCIFGDTSCPQSLDFQKGTFNLHDFTFYAQTSDATVWGTLNGSYRQKWDDAYHGPGEAVYQWWSHWRLKRIGDDQDPPEKVPESETHAEQSAPSPKERQNRKTRSGVSLPSASSYDPGTGTTTISMMNPDHSRTIKKIDRQGKIVGEKRETPPDQQLTSTSVYDRESGTTTSAHRNEDGSITITQKDRNGKIFTEKTIRR